MTQVDIAALAAQLSLVNTHCVCEAIAEAAPSLLAELSAARKVIEEVRGELGEGGCFQPEAGVVNAMAEYDAIFKRESA